MDDGNYELQIPEDPAELYETENLDINKEIYETTNDDIYIEPL